MMLKTSDFIFLTDKMRNGSSVILKVPCQKYDFFYVCGWEVVHASEICINIH